jgi:hypothetical protein
MGMLDALGFTNTNVKIINPHRSLQKALADLDFLKKQHRFC